MTQSEEEIDAHLGPEGPIAAARKWLDLVLDERDLPAAWPLTDPDYRRTAVEAWVDANASHPALMGTDRAALIDDLTVARPAHPLWRPFTETQVDEFVTAWHNVDIQKWGWGSRPRPHAPDYEIAALFEADGEPFTVETDTLLTALQLIMHHVPGVGWLMAGVEAPIAPAPERRGTS